MSQSYRARIANRRNSSISRLQRCIRNVWGGMRRCIGAPNCLSCVNSENVKTTTIQNEMKCNKVFCFEKSSNQSRSDSAPPRLVIVLRRLVRTWSWRKWSCEEWIKRLVEMWNEVCNWVQTFIWYFATTQWLRFSLKAGQFGLNFGETVTRQGDAETIHASSSLKQLKREKNEFCRSYFNIYCIDCEHEHGNVRHGAHIDELLTYVSSKEKCIFAEWRFVYQWQSSPSHTNRLLMSLTKLNSYKCSRSKWSICNTKPNTIQFQFWNLFAYDQCQQNLNVHRTLPLRWQFYPFYRRRSIILMILTSLIFHKKKFRPSALTLEQMVGASKLIGDFNVIWCSKTRGRFQSMKKMSQ